MSGVPARPLPFSGKMPELVKSPPFCDTLHPLQLWPDRSIANQKRRPGSYHDDS